ncbi:membrane integrity-associated transporter subunit PqiC [Paracoccus aestuarii]|uniref:Membrane integrity-associated transporter subunit PqiC n=1 Tax=Paracoccus aestuarii TaxID=453842 RepID=A0A418ZVB6_9RHOB|nr:PqiC family protein [Paracoccus aestuarii]RJL03369.1 membrane integrity-associated transporter subunit PqiC [Paracoccus aestuarii]WCQ99270.1 membrane integrity-associated transporter subunit PqiC [Paracoccus aestuarii]
MTLPALPALISLALLAACSNPERTGRFLLDPPVAGIQVPNRIGTAELKDVSLPEYASDQEVAFQTADGAVRSNPDNLWADSPSRAFTVALARAISDVSGATVIGEPWPLAQPPARRIEVRVERALAQADGAYRLSGRYFVADDGLTGGGANHARSFDIRVPMGAQNPATTAAAASQAVAILAQQIATLSGPGSTIATTRPATDSFDLPPLF